MKLSENFIILFLFLFISLIIPSSFPVNKFKTDLLFHFLYFFIFSLFCEKKEEKIFIIFIPLLTEIIQHFLPYRNFSIYDLISDYSGILTGFISLRFILKNKYDIFRFIGSGFFLGIIFPVGKGSLAGFITLLTFLYFPLSKLTLTLLLIFIYILHFLLRDFLKGKDPNFFVIDEVAGVLPIFYLNIEPFFYIIYFFLFRYFDIKKPLFIKKIEGIKNFNGVFFDDFISGLFSLIITFFLKKYIILS